MLKDWLLLQNNVILSEFICQRKKKKKKWDAVGSSYNSTFFSRL